MKANHKSEYAGARASFILPEWFPPQRCEYRRYERYTRGHAWEGQVDREHCENSAVDSIMKLKGVKEICYAMTPWIEVEIVCHPKQLAKKIAQWKLKLDRYLARFREAKPVKANAKAARSKRAQRPTANRRTT